MTTYSKLNIVYRLQKWMDSVAGQTFLNYAYSWGASIVILGTLFKLTHLPGANFFLFLGMGTEVFVFFISAFDRPFDKTTDGMELDIHMDDTDAEEQAAAAPVVAGGGTIVINGGGAIGGGGNVSGGNVSGETADHATGGAISFAGGGVIGGGASGGSVVSGGVTGGGSVGGSAPSADITMGDEMKEATSNYIDELNRLTEMLAQVSEQSQRLTRDSEEMENLNRTLTGISRVYEMQLKSASAQISTIDEINEQTRHMAEQIIELNKIYARMIEAMTTNMPAAPKQ